MNGPGWGYAVEFLPPSSGYAVSKVKIYGKLNGTGYENRTFDVLIWDKAQKELYKVSCRHTLFGTSEGWVDVDIPEVRVGDNFYVVVIPNTPRESGLYVGYDSSGKNEHSTYVRNWKIIEWLAGLPQETTNWMVRAVVTVSP